MQSSVLVVSDDLLLRGEARSLLAGMDIDCASSGIVGFKRMLETGKVDAIVLDIVGTHDTVLALDSIRTGKLNRYAITVVLVNDAQGELAARSSGANFTIRRSGSFRDELKKAIESAHSLMLREKRRYHRHPVEVSVEVIWNNRVTVSKMVDISERGACLECSLPIAKQPLQLSFSLPGLKQHFRVEAIAAWIREGKVGVQFMSFVEGSQVVLTEWLGRQMSARI
jgi:PilZ domain